MTGTPPLLPWTRSSWEPRTASTGESQLIILILCLRRSGSFNVLRSAAFVALLWIRIRIHVAVLDPDPELYWECGSRGSRSMEITGNQNIQIYLFSCRSRKLFVPS